MFGVARSAERIDSERRRAVRDGGVGPAPGRVSLYDPIERDQASARRAVVAGAEGERGFDFYCDAVRAHACPIMCAVNREASRLDWGEGGEALAHPVVHRQRLEFQRRCRLRAGC